MAPSEQINKIRGQHETGVKMPTLKEVILEFADCNTTLAQLGSQPYQAPLSLGTKDGYRQLYQQIAGGGKDYQEIRGQSGALLRRLKPVYHSNKYWQRYFGSPQIDFYPQSAWASLVPIEARPDLDLQAQPPDTLNVKISPVPRVLLYPFGWSAWISLRVTGEHSLEDLAALARHLATAKAYTLSSDPAGPMTLADLMNRIGKNIWTDVFDGGDWDVKTPVDKLSVITVLDKYGGVPDRDPGTSEGQALRQLVQPFGSPAQKPWNELASGLPLGGEDAVHRNYALQDGSSVFLWADHKLKSVGANRRHLRCYHNNTFLSLLQAWQLVRFLAAASKVDPRSPALEDLVKKAGDQIDGQMDTKELYRGVCLVSFLERKDVQTIIQKARG